MSDKPILLGKAQAMHTPTSNTRRASVVAQSCDLNVQPAAESILGRCEFYYRPLHSEYVKKSGVSGWAAIKAWATAWDPWDDIEVARKLLAKRDKLIPGNNTDGDWSRHANFMMRHVGCGHRPPAYYVGYGYYYCSTYGVLLSPKLSEQGKLWLRSARFHLQKNMEKGLKMNMASGAIFVPCRRFPNKSMSMTAPQKGLEVDNALFKTFAFNTHVPAYLDGGLADLPESDLLRIMGQPNIEEWTDKDTWVQAAESSSVVVPEKLKSYAHGTVDLVESALKKLLSWVK